MKIRYPYITLIMLVSIFLLTTNPAYSVPECVVSQIAEDATVQDWEYHRINNKGDVFWSSLITGVEDWEGTIYQYDSRTGETTVLTNCGEYDEDDYGTGFDINNKGDVAWAAYSSCPRGGPINIYLRDGKTQNVRQITNYTEFGLSIRMVNLNEKGDIVWAFTDGNDREIFLYESKSDSIKQITNNSYHDRWPNLNDKGDIVWISYDDGWQLAIYDHKTEEISFIADDNYRGEHIPPIKINNRGDVIWCVDVSGPIVLLYDGLTETIQELGPTINDFDLWENLLPRHIQAYDINNKRDVVWIEEVDPHRGVLRISLYNIEDGTKIQLSRDDFGPPNDTGGVDLNDRSDVVWTGYDDQGAKHIFLYKQNIDLVTQISSQDIVHSYPMLNDKSEVVWYGYDITSYPYQKGLFLYHKENK